MALLYAIALLSSPFAHASSALPNQLQGVHVSQSLGHQISSNQFFTDHTGKQRSLAEYFKGKKPVILTLNYFRCPMLCSLQLNGLVRALQKLPPAMLSQARIVTISFNHQETPDLAKQKRESYLKLLGFPQAEWHFLVGTKYEIHRLTKALGFFFRYLPKKKEYAHPSVIYLLTPTGKVSQYLSGITYNPRDLRFSLITASQGQVGSFVDRFVMSCFVYDVVDGKYTAFAFGMVRLGGGLTICFLAIFLGFFWVRERQHKRQEPVVEKST